MKTKKRKPKRPAPIKFEGKGFVTACPGFFHADDERGGGRWLPSCGQVDVSEMNAKDCRRVAKWLIKAAKWIDACERVK